MKKVITLCIAASSTFLAATGAQAETVKLVSKDDSELSELCVAAATSSESVFQLAKGLGINTLDISRIACNGEPIVSFVRKHRKIMHEASVSNYSFNRGDNSAETELCIAAVTEPDKFAAMKPEYLAKAGAYGDRVLCNSQPLNIFIKRYGNRELSAL